MCCLGGVWEAGDATARRYWTLWAVLFALFVTRLRVRERRYRDRSDTLSVGGTSRNYLSAAIVKTGACNRAQAIRMEDERGWL